MNHFDSDDDFRDGLGEMIRWSVRDSVGDAQPAPEVWQRVLGRVREIDCERRRTWAETIQQWAHNLWRALIEQRTESAELVWAPGWSERARLTEGCPMRVSVPFGFTWLGVGQLSLIY